MKIIYTRKGEEIFVDDEDYDELNKHTWHINNTGYAIRYLNKEKGKPRKAVLMHRGIMCAPKGMVVDHINHNQTDNQKNNLRVCTHAENLKNRKSKKGKVVGVYWAKKYNRWETSIGIDGKLIHLGTFQDYEEAVKIRQEAEIEYFGEYRNKTPYHDEDLFYENLQKPTSYNYKKWRKLGSANTSGVKGVYWRDKDQKWCAQIGYKKEKRWLGSFENIEEATEARRKAEEELFEKIKRDIAS